MCSVSNTERKFDLICQSLYNNFSWYAVSAATPHPEGFIHLDLDA